MRSKMSLTKESRIAITLFEIPVSGCACEKGAVAFEDVVDGRVQDCWCLVRNTGVGVNLSKREQCAV